MLIFFYCLLYLRLVVSELDFGRSGAVNGLVRVVSVTRYFLNDTNIFDLCDVCKHMEVTIEVLLILFYILTYLRLGVSKLNFGCSGVVNRLVCIVSVPRHFLNDTNISYITHVMCANTWNLLLKCRSFFFTVYRGIMSCLPVRY